MVNYLKAQCDKHGAKIVLKTPVTKELLEKEKADSVIIATGAAPDQSIPGSDKKHVVSLFDVLEGKAKLGQNVVIVGGAVQPLQRLSISSIKGNTISPLSINPKNSEPMSIPLISGDI